MADDQIEIQTRAAKQNVEKAAEDVAEADTWRGKAGQMGRFINVVVIAVTAIIGVLVYSNVEESLGTPDNNNLANAADNVTSGVADAMGLVPAVLVILVAALVIQVLRQFR